MEPNYLKATPYQGIYYLKKNNNLTDLSLQIAALNFQENQEWRSTGQVEPRSDNF